MRIKSIRLINYKRLYNGLGITEFEQEFDSGHQFVRIEAANGCGKSTLMSALSPLPEPASEIIPGSTFGSKRIEIEDRDITYVIEYVYRFSSDRHVTSATILKYMPDGEFIDLNPSTNVSTAKEIIYDIFGLDSNFEVLTQLSGYDNKSLAMMKPAERKKFITFILANLQTYNNIFKSLSKRSTVFKSMLNSITDKIDRIGGSPDTILQSIAQLEDSLAQLNRTKESLLIEINKINLNQEQYDANEKKKERCAKLEKFIAYAEQELNKFKEIISQQLNELETVYGIKDFSSSNELLSELRGKLSLYEKNQAVLTSKIESLKNKLESLATTKTFIEASMDYSQYREYLRMQSDQVKERAKEENRLMELQYPHISEDSHIIVSTQMNDLVRLIAKDVDVLNVEELNLLGRQTQRSLQLVSKVGEFSPAEIINAKHDIYDMIVKNVKQKKEYTSLVYELDDLDNTIMNIHEFLKVDLIYNRISNNIEVFATAKGVSYQQLERLTIVFDKNADGNYRLVKHKFNLYEALKYYDACVQYELNTKKIQIQEEYESKNLGRGEMAYNKLQETLNQINQARTDLVLAEKDIENLGPEITILQNMCKILQDSINNKVEFFNMSEKLGRATSELELIKDSIVDTRELSQLQQSLSLIEEQIKQVNKDLYERKFNLDTMAQYLKELEEYKAKCEYIDVLRKYCNPTTGIQTVFVDLYMNKILTIANELLQHLFGGQFVIQPFVINESEFRIPIQGNGLLVDDISSLSASQMAMVNMCISFALVFHSSTKYNIIKLDEVDSALDYENRVQYPFMLNKMMNLLGCEQCFMISHNTEFDDSNMLHINLKR